MMTTINYIPPEILIYTFIPLSESSMRDRSSLMAVCRRWYHLIAQTSAMWTKFVIHIKWFYGEVRIRNIITSLERSLDRAGTQLLHVTWDTPNGISALLLPRFYNLLRRAPFSRWRSLRLEEHNAEAKPVVDILKDDPGFINLESLHLIGRSTQDILLSHVNKTIGPRFRSFTISSGRSSTNMFKNSVNNILGGVSSIRIRDALWPTTGYFPPNITELDTKSRTEGVHPFITTFRSPFLPSESFISLNTLHLRAPLSDHLRGATVTLPTLRSLHIYGPVYFPLRYIHAPLLYSLNFAYDALPKPLKTSTTPIVNDSFESVFRQDASKYTLTPSEMHILQPFSTNILGSILHHSPTVTTLGIACEDAKTAQEILESLVHFGETSSMMGIDEKPQFKVCPELASLEIIGTWNDAEAVVESKIRSLMGQVQELRGLRGVKCAYRDGVIRNLGNCQSIMYGAATYS